MIAVTLGILETLQQEECGAFAHDEAVGAIGIRTRAGRRQRTDLAELDERRGAHVAIDAAGDDGIVIVFLEPFDGRTDRCHGRCAGRVHDVVGAMEIEQVGDAPRHDVGELARHRVLGNLRYAFAQSSSSLRNDLLAKVLGQFAETLGLFEFARELGEGDA